MVYLTLSVPMPGSYHAWIGYRQIALNYFFIAKYI